MDRSASAALPPLQSGPAAWIACATARPANAVADSATRLTAPPISGSGV